MFSIGRLRGAILRMAFRRRVAAIAGVVMLIPSLFLILGDYRWETATTDGLGLIAGATGVALLLAAMTGRRPDWVDPDQH